MLRRLVYSALAATMVVFAWLQVNDPDPALWVLLYGAAAVLFLAASLGWTRRWAVAVVWVAYAPMAVLLFPGFFDWLLHHPWDDLVGEMSSERQYIEDSRELLGLAIASACLVVLWRAPRDASADSG